MTVLPDGGSPIRMLTPSPLTSRQTSAVRVTPRTRRILLAVHLFTAVGLVGVALALAVLGVAGLTGADAVTVYPAMHRLAQAGLVPLGVAAFVIGVSQALLTGYGLTRNGWVAAKLGILTLLLLAALAVAVPGLGRAADAAVTPGAAVATAQQITATATPIAVLVLFGVATFLGVFKPRRTRRE